MNSILTQSGALYLGAVGAWDWSGTIVKYDTANDQTPDIPSYEEVQRVLVNRTKESYLGYSLTSGFYNGQSEEYVAIGAPRYKLEGAVVIYKPENGNPNFTNHVTIYPNTNNAQLGSYFGGAMLSVDINADSMDDLIVGAPLYIQTSYDLGRVYVYMATGSSSTQEWAQSTYMPIVLTGSAVGGRFGSAIASAGDLNKDGFNDVIIGAPYTDDNKGSVYVFHGTASGLNPNPQQEINAKSLSNNNLRYFGLSIQGGQDLDGNGYPDVAVGAPKSDAVVIFRTRPVVSFNGRVSFSEAQINVFECFRKEDRNCLRLTACLTGNGESVEENIGVTYSINLDSLIPTRDRKRVEFQGATTSDMITGTEVLQRGISRCLHYNITVKDTISDYSTPIEANFTFDLDSSHTSTPLSSVRDPNAVHSYKASATFARGCGSDDTCRYDLVLSGSVQVPAATLSANGRDLTNGGQFLVISQPTQFAPLTMKLNLTNTGDNAFDVRVSVAYNDQLGWKLGNIVSSNPDPSISCVTDDSPSTSESTNDDGYRSKLLVYRQSRLLGSIMETGQWCAFEINLTSTLLSMSGSLPNINATVHAYTIGESTNDTNPSDNTFTAMNPIRYRADATVSTRSPETTIPFNFTDTNNTIVSVRQIGDGTPDISVTYQVDSLGYSTIPFSTISFTFPYTMVGGNMQHLLYLYRYSCRSPQNNAQCTCDNSPVNPYGLLESYPTTNTTGLPNVTITANPNPIKQSLVYDCRNGGNRSLVECQTFTCNVTNMRANDLLEFHVDFRLWSQSLNLMNDTNVTFVSDFVYDTSGSNLLINNEGGNVTRISRTINTIARLFTEPIVVDQENNLWIYIVAAVAGLVLLIIIIIILWKLGFFKSKYAEKKEALEWSGPNQYESVDKD